MKTLLVLSLITISFNAFGFEYEGSEIQKCRHRYLELIKENKQLQNLKGGDQVQFFLHPNSFLKNNKNIEIKKDQLFSKCLENNKY